MLSLAPRVTWKSLFASVPERTAASGERRLKVGLLTGCVQRVMFPHVNQASIHVLAAEGCEVVAPSRQGCCGALALHAGRLDEARACARRTIDTFERADVDQIAVNAAGCGSSMKEYGHLLADDSAWAARARAFSARVRDVTEVLDGLAPPRAPRHRLALRVAYHDACHLAHGQRVRAEPRALLRRIPGLRLVELADSDLCCGSAGVYNVLEPEVAERLLDLKIARVAETGARVVAAGNPGCLLQIAKGCRERGVAVEVVHPVQLLARSAAAASARMTT